MGLLVLMGQFRKESVRDYWSKDPTISTPIFAQTMSRNRFEYIWQAWNFSENSLQTKHSGRLFKIFPVYEYFVQKFKSVYSPKQELSLTKPLSHGGVSWHLEHTIQGKNEIRITGENGV